MYAPRDPDDDVHAVRRSAATFGARPDDPGFVDLVRDFVRRHGWRAYALPILVVITVAALLTSVNDQRVPQRPTAARTVTQTPVGTPPVAAGNIELKSDTPGPNSAEAVLSAAALPSGSSYSLRGNGTFQVLPGTSRVVGTGPLHRYTIDVENGVTGIDLTQFETLVEQTLADPRSWSGHGVSLQRVDHGPADFHVTLTSAMTVRDLCGYTIPIETSCFAETDPRTGVEIDRVVIDDARWVRGDANYIGDLTAYRQYMINHEDGHALGHQHAHDCLSDGLAPAMMQQTIGLRSAVSGKLCQANPWPYPSGARDAPGAEAPDTPQNSEFDLTGD
jgi:hypothetical protein